MGTVNELLDLARAQLGTTSGEKYWRKYRGDTYVNGDVTAYCAYWCSWLLDETNTKCPWFPNAYAFDPLDVAGERYIEKHCLQPGDIITFDWDNDYRGDHVGVVETVHDWGCGTMEGNTSGGIVARKQRLWSEILCGVRPYYDSDIKQEPGDKFNDYGLSYRVHAQNLGWLPAVSDGQLAGTTGHSLRIESLKITPPAGIVLDAFAHVQDIGTLGFPDIMKGNSSGTGSSINDPIIGTTGKAKRLEAIMLRVVMNDNDDLIGKTLKYQVHVQNIGWQEPRIAGEWAGTTGQSKRIEAIRLWFE